MSYSKNCASKGSGQRRRLNLFWALWNSQNLGVVLLFQKNRPIDFGVVLLFKFSLKKPQKFRLRRAENTLKALRTMDLDTYWAPKAPPKKKNILRARLPSH